MEVLLQLVEVLVVLSLILSRGVETERYERFVQCLSAFTPRKGNETARIHLQLVQR